MSLHLLHEACVHNDISFLEGMDWQACAHNRTAFLKTLVDAVGRNANDVVRVVLEHSEVARNGACVLAMAAVRRNPDLLPHLLPHLDKEACTAALENAAHHATARTVALLLTHATPKRDNSKALQWASVRGDQRMFDLLYPVSDPLAALEHLQQISTDQADWAMLEARIQCDTLKSQVSGCGKTAGGRKL